MPFFAGLGFSSGYRIEAYPIVILMALVTVNSLLLNTTFSGGSRIMMAARTAAGL